MINIIAAVAENGVIGNENELPWVLPTDLQNFAALTRDNTVIMGWGTFKSLGEVPLRDRENIVLSRRPRKEVKKYKNLHFASNVSEALNIADKLKFGDVFVIGGQEVYKSFLPIADRMYMTRVRESIPGDRYFPKYSPGEWECAETEKGPDDEDYPYDMLTLIRKN